MAAGVGGVEQQKTGVKKKRTQTRTHEGPFWSRFRRPCTRVFPGSAAMSKWVRVSVSQASLARRGAPQSSRVSARTILTMRAPAAHAAGPSPATETRQQRVSLARGQPNWTWPPRRRPPQSNVTKRFHIHINRFHIRAEGFIWRQDQPWFDFLERHLEFTATWVKSSNNLWALSCFPFKRDDKYTTDEHVQHPDNNHKNTI